MRGISELIDSGTTVKKPQIRAFVRYGVNDCTIDTGYVAFVVGGKIHQRAIQAHKQALPGFPDTINYIVWRKEVIALDVVMKPISGAYNVESFKA